MHRGIAYHTWFPPFVIREELERVERDRYRINPSKSCLPDALLLVQHYDELPSTTWLGSLESTRKEAAKAVKEAADIYVRVAVHLAKHRHRHDEKRIVLQARNYLLDNWQQDLTGEVSGWANCVVREDCDLVWDVTVTF